MEGNTTISGSLKASLRAVINKKDVDVVIDLYEELPDGKFFNLNESIQRASYAQDRTTRHLLHPGKMEHIELNNAFLTSVRISKGGRIIVAVGVNDNPNW